jgi:hypothetical protein
MYHKLKLEKSSNALCSRKIDCFGRVIVHTLYKCDDDGGGDDDDDDNNNNNNNNKSQQRSL